MSGQALGLHSSGLLTLQGVGAALAGAVAQWTSAGTAMAVMAVASTAVTLALAPGLRGEVPKLPEPRETAGAGARDGSGPPEADGRSGVFGAPVECRGEPAEEAPAPGDRTAADS